MKNLLNSEIWAIKIGVIVLAAIVASFIFKQVLKRLVKISEKTNNKWDDALFGAASSFYLVIWLIAAKLSFDVAVFEFSAKTFSQANLALKIAVIFCIAKFLVQFVNSLAQKHVESDSEHDHTTIDAFAKLAKLLVIVIAVLSVMNNLGFNVSGLVAAGGVGGLVIGLSAKDMLANLFGGLTIYLDRPFGVGDWIKCKEKSIEGTVENIGWRSTRLRAFNKNPIYVPNSIFTNAVVENPSRMSNRRLEQVVGLRYCDMQKMEKITKDVKDLLDNHPKIDQKQVRLVNFMNFNSSSIDFKITSYSTITDWEQFNILKQEILLKVAQIVEESGASMAFPTRTIYMEK